jgi:uncharacterized protein YhjY with autotransporter beta-barrel domain
MNSHDYGLRIFAPAALLALSCSASWADTLGDNPLTGTAGDGLIFSDPEEGVLEPGVKAVTFTRTRVDDPDNNGEFLYLDPFEVIITDFSDFNEDIESRGDVVNCLMANNPGIFCDSAPGSGKRVKVQLTGPTPFDMTYATTPNGTFFDEGGALVDTSSVDYFTFGKVSNFTGARITGFTLQLLDADGNLMGELDPADAVVFNLEATEIGLGSRLVDGLFGAGGQEGDIGFFADTRAGFAPTFTDDTLAFGALSNAFYVENFGTAFLDDTMVPDGLFWDDNDNPDDESALIAWDNIAEGGWTYGNIALEEIPDDLPGSAEIPVLLPERLAELAEALDVDVADLQYAAGDPVPDAIVAAAEANGLFAVDAVEDLRNANLNYDITIGEIEGGEFTLRWTAAFAPIVAEAQSELEFKAAGYLDGAANVPYWDLGNAAVYQATIADILAMDPEAQAAAITSTTFSIAPAFANLGFETGRNQVAALTNMAPLPGGADIGVSQASGARSWLMTDGLYGLFSAGGSTATYDATSGSVGYDVSAASFAAGLEKSLNPSTSVGFAIGGSTGTAKAAGDLGEVEQTGISLTAFARSELASGGSFQALLGYQDLSYDMSRSVLDATADGSTDGSQIFGAVTVDYLRDFGAFKIGPKASLEYYDVTVDGFTETGAGAFNLTVAEQSFSTVVASLGVAGAYQIPSASGNSTLTGSVAYTNVSGDDLDIESGFVGLPSVTFPVQGLEQELIDVSLGFESVLSSSATRDVVISAGYGGAFGEDYERHGVQVGLSIQF